MKQSFFKKLANCRENNSFSNNLRRKRMKIFETYFPIVLSDSKIEILDVGGTWNYWKQMGYDGRNNIIITLLNLNIQKTYSDNINSVEGDACDLSRFKDKSFDIVFSNSVIEHVGNFQMQDKMAKELMRVGKAFYIQTPNYWFPFEPHTLTIGYQYLPISVRTILIQNFNLGWTGKFKEKEKAKEAANNVHLLSKRDLKKLFPNAIVLKEYFIFLVKSFILIQTSVVNEENK